MPKSNHPDPSIMTSQITQLSDEQKAKLRSAHEEDYRGRLGVALAIAAHRRTGWPIAVLRSVGGDLLHAGAHVPGGGYLDIRGIISEETFNARGEGRVSWGEDWALMLETRQIKERDVTKAAWVLDLLHDGLPGQSPAPESFPADLAKVCRKLGIKLKTKKPPAKSAPATRRKSGGAANSPSIRSAA